MRLDKSCQTDTLRPWREKRYAVYFGHSEIFALNLERAHLYASVQDSGWNLSTAKFSWANFVLETAKNKSGPFESPHPS